MNDLIILFITLLISSVVHYCQSIVEDLNHFQNDIDITHAPFALSLRLNGQHICGGAIISSTWGITAAHCITTKFQSLKNYSIRSGSTFRQSGGIIHSVTKIIPHEKYNVNDLDYDIAVFQITPSFKFDSTTQPISLPNNSVTNNYGTVIGWGVFSIFNDTILSNKLKCVTLPLIRKSQCIYDYDGFFHITPRQLCYGFHKGGADTCKGDSGGPLFNNHNILIGITSWGDGCGQQYSPGVYTNVQMMSDWIKQHIDP